VIELLSSNDPVVVTFAVSVLRDAEIEHSVADSHMAVIDGSIGAITNRILVPEDVFDEAAALLTDAGVSVNQRQD
jgi:hypothetical protein